MDLDLLVFLRVFSMDEGNILHKWSFHIKCLKGAFNKFYKFHMKWP